MILTLAQVGGVWQDTGLPPIVSTISIVDIISLIVLPIALPWIVGKVTNSDWPVFNKRALLFGLALVMTVLTDVVQHAATGQPYDITWALIHFIAVYLGGEGVYKGFLKAPLEVQQPLELKPVEVEGVDLAKLTKAELIAAIETPAQIEVQALPVPKTLASIIQKK